METNSIAGVRQWFLDTAEQYIQKYPQYRTHMVLKRDHTERVRLLAEEIGQKLGLDADAIDLAALAAICHDVGRFEQVAQIGEFRDSDIIDHGALGASIIEAEGVLSTLPESQQKIVQAAVFYHNKQQLPRNVFGTALLVIKLLRDADKLAIMRVNFGTDGDMCTNAAVLKRYPKSTDVSGGVYRSVLHRETVVIDEVANLNDLMLFFLSWIYDINFLPTLEEYQRMGYIHIIEAQLPQAPWSKYVLDDIRLYVEDVIPRGDTMGPCRAIPSPYRYSA